MWHIGKLTSGKIKAKYDDYFVVLIDGNRDAILPKNQLHDNTLFV